MWVSLNSGYQFGGPSNKDYSILYIGVCIGVPLFLGKYHLGFRVFSNA